MRVREKSSDSEGQGGMYSMRSTMYRVYYILWPVGHEVTILY